MRPLAGRLPDCEICHRPDGSTLSRSWVPPKAGGWYLCQPPVLLLLGRR